MGQLVVGEGIKTGPVRCRRDILDLLSAQREFLNNPGKPFVKFETSGRHVSHEIFKIKAAPVFNHSDI